MTLGAERPRLPRTVLAPVSWTARWAWLLVIIAGGAGIAGYFTAPNAGALELWYIGIGAGSTACVFWGIRLHRPADAAGWVLIGGGNLCFVLGDGLFAVYEFVLHQDAPTPSAADLLYLAGYPLLFAGIIRMARASAHVGSRENNADAAIVSIAALAVAWRLFIASAIDGDSTSWLALVVTTAYPIMDVGIVFIVITSLIFGGRRRADHRLIALAMATMLSADFSYDLLASRGTYVAGSFLDAGWLVAYILVGAAALHPSRAAVRPLRLQPTVTRRGWVPTVVLAGFTPSAILAIGEVSGAGTDDIFVFACISAVLFALVVLRGYWLLRRVGAQNVELEHRTVLAEDALRVRVALEADLRHQAFHDPLTALPNRNLLYDRVEHALAGASRSGRSVVMCFCDLDLFKTINDGMGHGVGDQILLSVAKRLRSVVRPSDTVARLGGDEFAVLLEGVADPAEAATTAERLLSVVREPIRVDGHIVRVTASIGVAFNEPDPAGTAAALLADADAAMYEAKADGRDRYKMFESAMRTRIAHRLDMTNAFPTALESGEFFLEYQPDYVLRTVRLHGFEALVRWNHPTLGRIAPNEFITLAEETGFIVPLGRWVLETACAAATTWSPRHDPALTIAVNLSVRQLQHSALVDDVRAVLAVTGLPANRLVLEVTESALMTNPAGAAATLARLRALGVRIAIDDFGTGHSSLSYLQQFPVDILKIDKSFVDPLADPASEATAFVMTILRLAEDLGLTTIAEGIEHPIQQTTLTQLGCDQAQGFLLSRPLPTEGAHLLTHADHPGTTPSLTI